MENFNNKLSRRQVLKAVSAAAIFAGTNSAFAQQQDNKPFKRNIKLGVIGCGGRGSWIANLFKQHGGYEMYAVADYFQHVADNCGNNLEISKDRRFSGLSGYKRLIDCGVEAVALETPPYFFPEHAHAAVQAGLHIYMAKPIAVDVPGCMTVLNAGKKSTQNKKVFLVDYQIPTDPSNIQVVKAIHDGLLGSVAQVASYGICHGFPDPPKTANIESRLQGLVWVNDIAIGGDYIDNFDIHAIDAALWAIGQRPVAAMGSSNICRPQPHGDAHDVCSVVFKYKNGVVHNHFGQAIKNNSEGRIDCCVFGQTANAKINYSSKAFVRGGKGHFYGDVTNLYQSGAERNIASFYKKIIEEDFSNDTFQRSVDGALTCILGRQAASMGSMLTMEQLIKDNQKLHVDLTGLKE